MLDSWGSKKMRAGEMIPAEKKYICIYGVSSAVNIRHRP